MRKNVKLPRPIDQSSSVAQSVRAWAAASPSVGLNPGQVKIQTKKKKKKKKKKKQPKNQTKTKQNKKKTTPPPKKKKQQPTTKQTNKNLPTIIDLYL